MAYTGSQSDLRGSIGGPFGGGIGFKDYFA